MAILVESSIRFNAWYLSHLFAAFDVVRGYRSGTEYTEDIVESIKTMRLLLCNHFIFSSVSFDSVLEIVATGQLHQVLDCGF